MGKSKRKYIWPKKPEYVSEMNMFGKMLYYLGAIKQKRFKNYEGNPYHIYVGGSYRSVFGLRWWNPLSIVVGVLFFTLALIGNIFNAFVESFDVISELNRQVISLDKPLRYETDGEAKESL